MTQDNSKLAPGTPGPAAPPAPPPQAVLMGMMMDGFILARCIGTAAVLGIADHITEQPRPVAEVAQASGTDPDALFRLLRMLAGAGIFALDAQQRVSQTPLSGVLRKDAPGSLHDWVGYMGHDWYWQVWSFLPQTIQNGRTVHENVHHQRFFEWYKQNPEYGRIFDAGMSGFSVLVNPAIAHGYDFSGIRTLVDVAGGQGSLLSTILGANPHLKGTLFDQPEVLQHARAKGHLNELLKADRLELVEGDLFKALPAGRDAYLFKWIIHDWSDAESKHILGLCRQAMTKPHSKLLLAEMVMPDGPGPSVAKTLDIGMMALTGGRERTVEEYRALLASAGFELQRVVPTPSPFSMLEAVPR